MRSILHDRDRAVPRSRTGALLALAFCSSVLAVACGGGDDDDAPPPPPPTGGTLIIGNENNYTSEASLTIPGIDVAAATDLTVNWSGLDKDLQCHAPGTIKMLTLLRFRNKTEQQVQERLVGGPIAASELDAVFTHKPTSGTTASLGDFEDLSGEAIDLDADFAESATLTYLLIAANTDKLGVGTVSMAFLRPSDSESQTTAAIGPGCGILAFTAELSSRQPTAVPAAAPYIADWTDLEVDGQGLPIDEQSIDRLLLGFYPNMSVTALEMDIFDIETLANPLWEMPISGTSANLTQARQRTSSGTPGEAFSSFDQGEGTWMIALTCSTCQNPQPIVLTILEPSSP